MLNNEDSPQVGSLSGKLTKAYVGACLALIGVLGGASVASAGPAADLIEDQVTALQAELLLVAAAVLAAAVVFLAIRKGWTMVRRMV